MIELTNETIDSNEVLSKVQSNNAGAVVLFLGTTREFTNGKQTLSLDYECYPEMAKKKLEELEQQARQKWELVKVLIVHRLGHLELGEASIAIAVSSAHRQASFEAGKWLIDTIKEVVPIWKKENWSDGTTDWVHPGVSADEQQPADEQSPKPTQCKSESSDIESSS
jgi:molybdopterin synthase catalytic subunit